MLLVLLAAGLSLIFGLMRILELAHVLLSAGRLRRAVGRAGDRSFVLAALAGGGGARRGDGGFFPGRLPHQEEPSQALLTFGFLLIIGAERYALFGRAT